MTDDRIVALLEQILAELRATRLAVERLSKSTLTRVDRAHVTAILPAIAVEYSEAFLSREVAPLPAVRATGLSARALGKLFVRAELQVMDDGRYVERMGEERGHALWRVRQVGAFGDFDRLSKAPALRTMGAA